MSHANAKLAPRGRLELAICVVEEGWALRRAAERFQVSPTTAARWARRYRELGPGGMADRSSRPLRSPGRTPTRTERRIIKVRVLRRWGAGPHRIPARLAPFHGAPGAVALPARSTELARPSNRASRAPLRVPHPGDLVHLDTKKLGRIPDGGGHRVLTAIAAARNKRATTTRRRPNGTPVIGYHFLHTALDDHSRLAYSEILPNERDYTAAEFWLRANSFFRSCGITTRRVLTDNGNCYRSAAFAAALATTGTTHRRTRPYRPQTNGKVERFHRTLADEWAYARPYRSDTERCDAYPTWIHTYNHHRGHTALDGQPPASRVPNLSGQNT